MDDERREPGRETFHLLFVCTGNTCRSPMAEGLARKALEARGWDHVTVSSAGVAAFPGSPISGGALRAGAKLGLSLESHRSSPLTLELLERADLVLAMSKGHLAALDQAGAGHKSALLPTFARGDREIRPDDEVPDPFSGDDEMYESTLNRLETLVEESLDRLSPILSAP